jgi:hypothetical protein
MALQTDSDVWTITAEQSNTESFNDTFDNAPVDLIVFGVVDKEKSMVDADVAVSTTQADVASEDTSIRYFAKEPGYDAGSASTHPEMDSGLHSIVSAKTLEAVSFNDTFSSTPEVMTGYNGNDGQWKGGKTSAANITTTGCDVAGETKGTIDNVAWWAIYTNGFWEAS